MQRAGCRAGAGVLLQGADQDMTAQRAAKAAAALIVLMLAVPAAAQQTTGNITGRVLDDQGAAVPGATVTATSTATGFDASTSARVKPLPYNHVHP